MNLGSARRSSNGLVAKGTAVALTYLSNVIDEISPDLLDDITIQELQGAVGRLRVSLDQTITDAKRRKDHGQLYFDPTKKR